MSSGSNQSPEQQRPESRPKLLALGSLESEVLSVVCANGGGSVHDIRALLPTRFAYTTVMTTLDRLFKKDLLDRRKSGRRFLYVPKDVRAAEQTAPNTPSPRWPVLTLSPFASYLLEAVGTYDETLLQELEKTIANRRLQFEQGGKG